MKSNGDYYKNFGLLDQPLLENKHLQIFEGLKALHIDLLKYDKYDKYANKKFGCFRKYGFTGTVNKLKKKGHNMAALGPIVVEGPIEIIANPLKSALSTKCSRVKFDAVEKFVGKLIEKIMKPETLTSNMKDTLLLILMEINDSILKIPLDETLDVSTNFSDMVLSSEHNKEEETENKNHFLLFVNTVLDYYLTNEGKKLLDIQLDEDMSHLGLFWYGKRGNDLRDLKYEMCY